MKRTNRDGIVMIVVVSFLTVLVFLGGTIAAMLTVNVRQSGHAMAAAEAWQQAEAGADLVFARIRADELNGSLTLSGASVSVNYAAPSGLTFDTVTTLARLANPRLYSYRVTGRTGDARAIIEVVVGRSPDLNLGVFGNQSVSLAPNVNIRSYDSSVTTAPTSSTGASTVGSNGSVGGDANAIDGAIYLGESTAGTPASYSHTTGASADVVRMTQIPPDPLGASGGALAAWFNYVAVTNNNGAAVGGTQSGGKLRITGDVTLTAGNYYVSDIDIGNNRTLTINASGGPVRLFLTGGASTMPNATITVNSPHPHNLQIYANGTSAIFFQPNLDFIGYIYAPFAPITIQPNGDFRGAVWANAVTIRPNGNFYVDTDFVDRFDFDQPLKRVSWKHVTDG